MWLYGANKRVLLLGQTSRLLERFKFLLIGALEPGGLENLFIFQSFLEKT